MIGPFDDPRASKSCGVVRSAACEHDAGREAVAAASLPLLLRSPRAGCGGIVSRPSRRSPRRRIRTSTASVTTHGRYSYPPVLVNNFMAAARGVGQAKKAYCRVHARQAVEHGLDAGLTRIGLRRQVSPVSAGRSTQQRSPAPTSCSAAAGDAASLWARAPSRGALDRSKAGLPC